ncbi:MAG: 16S rRNA (uracil(1498)-N(3))-methyltransferase [Pseudomonadota bacterium]
MSDALKIRLYLDQPLGAGQSLTLSRAQSHYLGTVMRLGPGAGVAVFNGRDGEWRARVEALGKREGTLEAVEQVRPQAVPPDITLAFAPIKKERTDFIVEKATELGVARIAPVLTEYSNTGRINLDRLKAHAVEAAEQCGGTYVPEISALSPLPKFLQSLDERRLIFCDEMRAGVATTPTTPAPAALLIGPEGGFSQAERARLHALPGVETLSLGPRILRADTAAVAALTLWQAAQGDWT